MHIFTRVPCPCNPFIQMIIIMYFFGQNVILSLLECLVFCYFLCFLYKGLNKALCDPGKHRHQTKSHLRGYFPGFTCFYTLNSGQHTTFNRHDLTARSWVTLCVCASFYASTVLHCYFVYLFRSICFAMVILSDGKMIFLLHGQKYTRKCCIFVQLCSQIKCWFREN